MGKLVQDCSNALFPKSILCDCIRVRGLQSQIIMLKPFLMVCCHCVVNIYSIFCFFALLPQETSKRKNAVIYSILLLSKSQNLLKKCAKTILFSDFRSPPIGGDPAKLASGRLRATRMRCKIFTPSRVKDFCCFSGSGVGGSAAGARAHHRAVPLGRS